MSGKEIIKIEAKTALGFRPGPDGGVILSVEKFGATVYSHGIDELTGQLIIAAIQNAMSQARAVTA